MSEQNNVYAWAFKDRINLIHSDDPSIESAMHILSREVERDGISRVLLKAECVLVAKTEVHYNPATSLIPDD
jgi:hypothetical protein